MAKKLVINLDKLSVTDKAMLEAMRTAMQGQPDEIVGKALKAFPQFKDVVELIADGPGKSPLAAKIEKWLADAQNQAKLMVPQSQLLGLNKQIDETASMTVSLFDEALEPRWVMDDQGAVKHLVLKIPANLLGAAPELLNQVQIVTNELNDTFTAGLKADGILKEDKKPGGGRLTYKADKKAFEWIVPERKKREARPDGQPAPKRERAGKNSLVFDVKYGEQIVARDLTNRSEVVEAVAKFAIANGVKKASGRPFTSKEATPGGSYNWPNVYAKIVSGAGFTVIDRKVEPEAPKAEEVAA